MGPHDKTWKGIGELWMIEKLKRKTMGEEKESLLTGTNGEAFDAYFYFVRSLTGLRLPMTPDEKINACEVIQASQYAPYLTYATVPDA